MGQLGRGWFLLGAPWDSSGTGRGERDGPDALRQRGLAGCVTRDLGDAATTIDSTERDEATGVRALPASEQSAKALADALGSAMAAHPDLRPLVIGGDCSILLGIIPAVLQRIGPVGLWFLDGHPDYLDGAASDTGEVADMDLAIVTGTGAASLTTLAGRVPMVPVEDVVLIGHRTIGLDHASSQEVQRLPAELRRIDAPTAGRRPAAAGHQALAWLEATGRGSWLHIDVDVLDPAVCPAVTYPQAGGLDWAGLAAVLEPLLSSPRLLGISVADYRPDLDPRGAVADRLVNLLEPALR